MDRVLRRLAEARPFDVPPRAPREKARPPRKLILIPAAAVAVAAVVAVVAVGAALTLTGGQTPTATIPPAPQAAAPKDARQVLLAAATRTEATQPGTGRHWLTRTESGHVYRIDDAYKVMGRTAGEVWHPLTSQDAFVHCSRWLGFQPITEADRAAWQAAGSPATLNAGGKEPARTLTLGPGERECRSWPDGGGDRFTIAGVEYSLEQLRALPTDPAQLRAALEQAIPEVDAQLLFLAAGDILMRVPAAPALRAAAYRMLADLPGIDFVEGVTDLRGRTGSGVEHTLGPKGPFRIRPLIDLNTGQTLAHEQRYASDGELVYTEAVVSSELTDQAPPPPSA